MKLPVAKSSLKTYMIVDEVPIATIISDSSCLKAIALALVYNESHKRSLVHK